jgi:hypothetical protein
MVIRWSAANGVANLWVGGRTLRRLRAAAEYLSVDGREARSKAESAARFEPDLVEAAGTDFRT